MRIGAINSIDLSKSWSNRVRNMRSRRQVANSSSRRICCFAKEYGRYHAIDIYAVLAATTQLEWDRADKLRKPHQNDVNFVEAVRIVDQYFSSLKCEGMLRMARKPILPPGPSTR